jgi:hypothetical protein
MDNHAIGHYSLSMFKDNEYYKTSDLSLATTLSLGFPIESTELGEANKVIFVFKNTQLLNSYVAQYWRGEIKVDPVKFFNQLKVIKTRIYSAI